MAERVELLLARTCTVNLTAAQRERQVQERRQREADYYLIISNSSLFFWLSVLDGPHLSHKTNRHLKLTVDAVDVTV